ncbi:MAG: hypothetical protein MJK14_27210 [Rivularia sp. ALOHA_DT_140]|nr:hypothetical protein [Rivularia sp. ALOHA_DT_140]
MSIGQLVLLDKETRNYFRKYIKENRDSIRKNGTAKVYAFSLDFQSKAPNTVEFSKPNGQEGKIVDRLRDSKDKPSQNKPENISRSSTTVKIQGQPNRSPVVVPTDNSAPVKLKPQIQIRTKKPASASGNSQELPKVPARPNPQARVNVKEPAPQNTSKPSLATRLRNTKKESEDDSKETSDSKNLIQRLRKIQKRRENSN